ncbi:hypothetical protein BKA25_005274 [Actinoalloteichus hymeniacidonis]|uniref:Uncharacterized protein n=1 Tax=Actinoalloteichus hymeniacidonis TaxID=340345 RepID=A0AAC9HKJ9_9PSEU|nr:hypothetical protein TL08_00990 [Actinoalloteichus hymeniacidonis]MBB5910958.1 hypothetical protein [Actinoalloteichus hymeniacidonis]
MPYKRSTDLPAHVGFFSAFHTNGLDGPVPLRGLRHSAPPMRCIKHQHKDGVA